MILPALEPEPRRGDQPEGAPRPMQATHDEIVDTIRSFLKRANKGDTELHADTGLYGDGIGLNSLDAAELSAILEDRHGRDPFSSGELPATVGDIVSFYR
jgi:acyl carrier protein